MNTCRSVDSKWFTLHKNCAVLELFFWGMRTAARARERERPQMYTKIEYQRSNDLARKSVASGGRHQQAGRKRLVWLSAGHIKACSGSRFLLIDFEGFFFVAAHEVDVEWVTPTLLRRSSFLRCSSMGRSRRSGRRLRRDEFGVVAADFAVVEIVIFARSLTKEVSAGGNSSGLYLEMRSIT